MHKRLRIETEHRPLYSLVAERLIEEIEEGQDPHWPRA